MSSDEVLADVTRRARELTAFISSLGAKNLTAGDRTALRALLEQLEAFAHAAAVHQDVAGGHCGSRVKETS